MADNKISQSTEKSCLLSDGNIIESHIIEDHFYFRSKSGAFYKNRGIMINKERRTPTYSMDLEKVLGYIKFSHLFKNTQINCVKFRASSSMLDLLE